MLKKTNNMMTKFNMIIKNVNEIVETLAAVHTHTHTGYCLLENIIKLNSIDNIKKDRTMLYLNSKGLSFCSFTQPFSQ